MNNKILFINQHSSNHGDEAAGKALITSIGLSNCDVSILYNTVSKKAIIDFGIKFNNILLTQNIDAISKILLLISFLFPIKLTSLFFYSHLRKEYQLIKESDVVISMPGGANIGLYHDWRYLWRIYTAIKLNKSTAIYSTSIGPFRKNLFKLLSKYVLTNVDFLSLRDAQSFRYANEMNIKYTKSIDTAFLTQPIVDNFDLSSTGIPYKEKDYVVVVANDLTSGHLTFKNMDSKKLNNLYLCILRKLLENKKNIVFLPQLFANGNDRKFFEKLILELEVPAYSTNIYIVDENFSSDIQQNIVRKSQFVIGARYHSIIFSINNNIPFLCLSYENKMKNTLEILELSEFGVDLTELVDINDTSEFNRNIQKKLTALMENNNNINNILSKKIANDCFVNFRGSFLSVINKES